MKKRFAGGWAAMLMVAVMVSLTGCGGGAKKAATPEETYKTFLATLNNEEFEKIYDMNSKEQREKMDGQAKKLKETVKKIASNPQQIEKLKKMGVTDAQLKDVTGKDVVRISIAMSQIMMEMFTPKGKPAPDILKEMKGDLAKTKVLSTEISSDGKTAKLMVQNAKGKKVENVLLLEDGEWKLSKVVL